MDIPYTVTARPDTGLYNGKLGVWLFLASEVMLFGALFTAYLFMRLGADEGTWPQHIQSIPAGFTNTCLLICSSITMVYAWVALKERNLAKYRLFLGATIVLGLAFLCVKGYEYHDKWMHWGFMIKPESIEKYRPALEKQDAFMNWIPTMGLNGAWEVRGHLHEKDDAKGLYTIAPDKNFHPYTLGGGAAKSASGEATGAADAEETVTISKDDLVRPAGNLLPAYGTYYAMYFTVTGLHALHIIGGVTVMLYFLGPGSLMYRRNPEQLSNRIEVTGIFWHFVDLVWITVFPIIYLT
jgi:cytochrome c oxidase subunit 3